MPNSFTVNKTEATNKIVFVSFDGNVDTDQLPFELGTGLFDTKRFTIARETRDKRRVEKTGLNNFLNIFEVTKLDEGIIFLRNQVLNNSGFCGWCLIGLFEFLLNSQVPLTTTSFEITKFLSDSHIVVTIHCTPCTNIRCSDVVTVEGLKRAGDVFGGECHSGSFQQSHYKGLGRPNDPPLGQFVNWSTDQVHELT